MLSRGDALRGREMTRKHEIEVEADKEKTTPYVAIRPVNVDTRMCMGT